VHVQCFSDVVDMHSMGWFLGEVKSLLAVERAFLSRFLDIYGESRHIEKRIYPMKMNSRLMKKQFSIALLAVKEGIVFPACEILYPRITGR
jgi:hypothetical protein